MTSSDAQEVARLSGQLGYPTDTQTMQGRLASLLADANSGIFVAESDGDALLGWVHVYGVRLLEDEPHAEIGGLVVDDAARQQGAGRALMSQAESWAGEHGFAQVKLRSAAHREKAHLFYERIGYTRIKMSVWMGKELRGD